MEAVNNLKAIEERKDTIQQATPVIHKISKVVANNMMAFYTRQKGNPELSLQEKLKVVLKFKDYISTTRTRSESTKNVKNFSTYIEVPKIALNRGRFIYVRRR